MTTIPSSRSEWAALDWQEAQHAVAQLLNQHGYLILEEKALQKNSRSDVVVIRILNDQVIFGIIEVKCYQKVTRSLQKSAIKQSFRYIRALVNNTYLNQRWGDKEKKYFVAIIYTNDYPASFYTPSIDQLRTKLPNQLENLPEIIISTPNSLLRKLEKYYPPYTKQARIDDFL